MHNVVAQTVGVEKRESRVPMILLWVVLGLAMLATSVVTLPYVVISPAAFGIGLAFMLIYLFAGTWLFRASSMWPQASWGWYLASVFWGAGVSLSSALVVGGSVTSLVAKLGLHDASASFGGAYPEEIAKATGVAVILFTFRSLRRPWHGFVTGGLIGLGFETVENLTYGVMGGLLHPDSDAIGALQMWGLRLLLGPGLHIVFSSIAGYGIGLAFFRDGLAWRKRLGVALGFLGLSFSLHFAWNYSWGDSYWAFAWLGLVALVVYPTFITVWRRCHRQAREDKVRGYGPPITALDGLSGCSG